MAILTNNTEAIPNLLLKIDEAIRPAFGPPYKLLCSRQHSKIKILSKSNQKLLEKL
jgi:hypothetical protein